MTDTKMERRNFLKNAIAITGGLATFSGRAFAEVCQLTRPQGEGPYYPESDLNRDNDLTNLGPGSSTAEGQIVHLTGLVQDTACRPLVGAHVEIWQACESGKYNHSDDPNPLPLDKAFQYWGRMKTDSSGRYTFKTIIPGHYPIGGGNFRPPHIHFKVSARQHQSLTTQSYFDPSSYDDKDLAALVDKLNRIEGVPDSLKVKFVPLEFLPQEKTGTFDITLSPIS